MASAKESSIHSEATISLLPALDLGLVWKRHSDGLWRQIDPDIWLTTRNPWLMLQQAPEQMLDSIAGDNGLRRHVEKLVLSRRETCNSASWFEKTHSGSPLSSVAYFSMEFGLSEALPIYSGGLGNVAGDQLKAGSDLPVQLVIAGKAHPADQPGKAMLQEWIRYLRRHDIREHAVFLVDYDMLLAGRIVEGVNVWINTPAARGKRAAPAG
jgi:glucan phosphorylase